MNTKYSQEQLHEAFTKIQNKDNWKNPIDAVIDRKEEELITEAVVHFAGCVPTYEPIHGTTRYRVRAAGYYQTIGA